MDRRKDWRSAERLLKQGKVQAALEQLGRISDDGPSGIVTLNRLADMLAQMGRHEEAIGYYSKIARRFEDGGFESKAIAIHKKILRLNAEFLDSARRLGELYARQKLHGEARRYLLHAAGRYLECGDFAKARDVYQRLVEIEPEDLRHRARLAEACAAQGETDRATTDLTIVGNALLARGEAGEAETIFTRVQELDPGSERARIGLARCREATASPDEALELLRGGLGEADPSPELLAEAARLHEAVGHVGDALDLLRDAPLLDVPVDVWLRMFRGALERGNADTLWEGLDAAFRAAAANGRHDALAELWSRLADIEADGHLPALVRVAELHETGGEIRATVRALDRLAKAYRARSMEDEAARVLIRMRHVAPPHEEPRAVDEPPPPVEPTALADRTAPDAPAPALDAEAPAVPLNRADEEFVSGRITQAEVLEKYDLLPQAVEQLDEVVARFPGHVLAQRRRLELVRGLGEGERGRRAEALAQLAIALRAAGETAEARRAAEEAISIPNLPTVTRRMLERLGVVAAPGGAKTRAAASATASQEVPSARLSDVAPPPSVPSASGAGPSERPGSSEVVIDLEADDTGPVSAGEDTPTKAPAAPASGVRRTPSPDMIEDIRQELDAENLTEARRRFDALVVLGYAGDEMDALRADIERRDVAASPAPEAAPRSAAEAASVDQQTHPAEVETPPADAQGPAAAAEATESAEASSSVPPSPTEPIVATGGPGDVQDRLEGDEDLDAIKAAFEEGLLGDHEEPVLPEESEDESMEEILHAFRAQVKEEVDAEDHRTHYDLGIGLKEMGLVDEAIHELRLAVGVPELHREACTMLAICYRERNETDEALRWYLAALERETADSEAGRTLRYDLAELLLEAGDAESALDHFRNIMAIDPSFRDVRGRVSELESRLES